MKNDELDLGPRKKIAEALAHNLLQDVGLSQAPVSLSRVISHVQTTRSLVVLKTVLTENLSGLLVIEDEHATIGFNENDPWCRQRFTVAHEIGHLFLGHTCNNDADGAHNEKEAHLFAAELLIPTSFLKKDFKKMRSIPDLARLYRVSQEAMSIKLMTAKLLMK